jgi:phosphoesterase RecJ-like protein
VEFEFDAVICLDAPEIGRTGAVAQAVEGAPLFIIDHHPYRNDMADFAWVDPRASSTGEMLFDFMAEREELIDSATASCLYAAIMTDTGRFTYANTTGKTLEVAARLVSLGASPYELARACYENVSDGQLLLYGTAAANMKRAADGKVAYTVLTAAEFERAQVGPEAATDLAEMPRSLAGVEIGVLFREINSGTKVSLRSKSEADVKEIAEHFGGGGHHKASGFLLELPIAEAEILVTGFLEKYLERRRA